MHRVGDDINTEDFLEWYSRSIKPFGVEFNMEMLRHSRQSQTNQRKRLKEDPEFAARLAALEAEHAARKAAKSA